jgi:VanZ family protein
VAVLAFLTWEPFDCSPGLALSRLRDLSLIPFADTFRGNYLTALEQLVQKFVLFIPLGVLLAPAGDAAGRPGRRWPGVVTAVLLAGGLEVGQLFLPSRSASIGDVLVEALGACVGLAVCSRIRQTT